MTAAACAGGAVQAVLLDRDGTLVVDVPYCADPLLVQVMPTASTALAMVRAAGRGALHRYHRVENGNHTDGLVDAFPDRLVPLAPEFRKAVIELAGWLR